ncbi:hypothetical protein, variant [Verruconis gallopava]|uniref:Nucleolar 27S pre-rRNA processing Urb2/Npa2 C-terminal domain-containing protein n=1 Tax=Verruconis gallopava TaxID=253628 RepID=A0A0D1YFA6_9PEZI|nr:uncharacterized protein PV09_08872 [Verruconis gallopava]XP_016209312.1 hypothetical protein, variant [Verruconis gallopava]KIV99441.1 hypothetical protein PV09_08872 [Verruconis gallopava]KIV99442.1 hypothetical protein, variant [Verruconis gallopava]
MEPSLPRLLSLDKRHNAFDESVKEAAAIAGISLTGRDENVECKSPEARPSRTRAEFALRWVLDKLKTSEGRLACQQSQLVWPFLRQLLHVVPAAVLARNAHSCAFVKNLRAFLSESEKKLAAAEPASPHAAVAGQKMQKKRKRGEKETIQPSQSASTPESTLQSLQDAILGVISVLRCMLRLATGEDGTTDRASREQLSSALRANPEDAAYILDAWLRCLKQMLPRTATNEDVLTAHHAILCLWSSRSLEQNDETGESPETFSNSCLVSSVRLLRTIHDWTDPTPIIVSIGVSLEQLLAKHVFVPARTLFDSAQSAKHPDIQRSRAPLNRFLEPVRSAIVDDLTRTPSANELLVALPKLLDLAIRLSPHSIPSQRNAQILWFESVFAALSACAMEPIPHSTEVANSTHPNSSPLTPMLRILKDRNVQLSNDFLESILVGYSGLSGLRKGSHPLRLDVTAALLDLNGAIFLIENAAVKDMSLPVVHAGQPPYVEALVGSLSQISWSGNDATPIESHAGPSTEFGVCSILIPLLRAYASARKLASFVALWFWEVRRQWKTILNPKLEPQSPWISRQLLQRFRDHLEQSLSSVRVGELLVEFILPVRQLVDEASSKSSKALDWQSLPTAAPACAALVMLDMLLHSVEREETLRNNPAAWNALKDLPDRLAILDMEGLPVKETVWSVLTRVYKFWLWVDGKIAFLERQRFLLDGSDVFKRALDQAGSNLDALAANELVVTVCGFELDMSLQGKAAEALKMSNEGLLQAIDGSVDESDVAVRLSQTIALCVQYPALFSLMEKYRVRLFDAFIRAVAQSKQGATKQLLDALVSSLVDDESASLRDFISVLTDLSTSGNDSVLVTLAIDCLLAIPPSLIPRPRREHLLDEVACLQQTSSADEQSKDSKAFLSQRIALLVRLLSCPNPTARLCIEPLKAYQIADTLESSLCELEGAQCTRLLQSIDDLFTLVTTHALQNATEERQRAYFDAFIGMAKDRLNRALKKSTSKPSSFSLAAVTLLTKSFLISAAGIGRFGDQCTELREQIFSLLERKKTQVAHDDAWTWLARRTVLGLARISSSDFNTKAQHLLEKCRRKGDISAAMEIESVFNSNFTVKPHLTAFSANLRAQEYCRILNIFDRQASQARIQQKLEMIEDLLDSDSVDRLQLLHIVIKHLSPDEVSDLDARKQILVQVCRILAQTNDIKQFGSAIGCISTILRLKTFLVTQQGIDTLLQTLTTISSSQSPHLPVDCAGVIYSRLCQVATSIILLHRRRLGGRMHLIVGLLQNLLSCLYTPHRYEVLAATTRPAWLQGAKVLGVDAANSFTRVVTTLCSPTVSSTVSHRGFKMTDIGLVDETKKAKEYAGQYVSYILLHYCTLQLQGSTPSEVAEKLKIGLWAIMEVVNIETMRGMNAGMGREERIVWGALFAEWNRLGRFKLS